MEKNIRRYLSSLQDPITGKVLADSPTLAGVSVFEDRVQVILEVPPADATKLAPLKEAVEEALRPTKKTIQVILTAQKAPKHGPKVAQAATNMKPPGVRAVIAVASGKGGVGKSTTAINLALALRDLGLKVGVLDADVYGPSFPMMLGVNEKPAVSKDKKLIPIERFGLRCMSIGFMIPEDKPVIWRGPMVQGALQQMIQDVVWGELDILIIDTPPGTGDVQLTLAQRIDLAGAIIVTTPQDMALTDARKGANMFKQVKIPLIGLIENMSHFSCPHCGQETALFGHDGGAREAAALDIPFLGALPLDLATREASDQGIPIVVAQPDGSMAQLYRTLSEKVVRFLEKVTPTEMKVH